MAKVRHRFTGVDYIQTIDETRVKYKDVFHLKMLYTDMHDWLVENGWAPSSETKFPEIFYHHRWTQASGEEVRWWWRLSKELNSYYKFEIDINVLTVNLKQTEVVIDGKKFKANTGEPEIKVFPRIICDWKRQWRDHWFLKHIHPIMYRRVFHKELELHRQQLHYDVIRFMDFLKTHFKLMKYTPEPEGEQFFANRDFE